MVGEDPTETPDDEFLARAGTELDGFAAALFAESRNSSWIARMRRFEERADWAPIRDALLRSSDVDAGARSHEPGARRVLEVLLAQLGRTRTDEAIARLSRIALSSPRDELRIHALHALRAAGPKGVDAVAGPPGHPPDGGATAQMLRAKAALARGDRLEDLWRGDAVWKNGVLRALADLDASDTRPRFEALVDRAEWIAVVVDAMFDAALVDHAEVVLHKLPRERWKALVDARKKAARKAGPPRTAKPSAKVRAALDEELAHLRDALVVIVQRLRADGYAFQGDPLRPPTKRYAATLKKLERRVGRVPLALARFWAIVGAVDLRGNHPAWAKKTWIETSGEPHWLADPLVVDSLDDALASAEDSDFDAEDATEVQRYALDLSGDEYTKANFSGGSIRVLTPSDEVDPRLDEREESFMTMLREAIVWRGFRGFARIDDAPFAPDHW
jgi:hypothetical protein